MERKFTHQNVEIEISKLAYDLSIVYAKSKLDEMLRTNPEYFYGKPAYPSIEEAEFLLEKFKQAYCYYSDIQPGEIERAMQNIKFD